MNENIYFANIVCIIIITVLCAVAVIYVEIPILEEYPPQLPDNLTMGQWIDSFQKWAVFCVLSAGVTSLLWYGLAQWVFKIDGVGSGKRMFWLLLCLVPVIAIVVSCIYVEQTESNLMRTRFLFGINGLLPYYLITLLLSPLSFKYTPIGAEQVRSRCFW